MQDEKVFRSLVVNAFDFLKRGIDEFDVAPKYSVVHFCAAVEMLLKARLMREHWSLIVAKPDQATVEKFMAGDFISVTLEEARNRLRDIADESIEGHCRCPECGKTIEPTDIVTELTDDHDAYRAMKDGDDRCGPSNCGNCEGHHTVVEISDQYFCAECFDISDRTQQCGYCGEYNTGDMKFSYSNGCGKCEGQGGHTKDD